MVLLVLTASVCLAWLMFGELWTEEVWFHVPVDLAPVSLVESRP